MRKADLERWLDGIPGHPDPKASFEQYRTPSAVAAALLGACHADGALQNRRVLDLGCGTGVFALGARFLGAATVLGVDVDGPAIDLARSTASAMGLDVAFETHDVRDWTPEARWDTVLMNPPFGAQRANRHGDRPFYDAALHALVPGGSCWFLAQENSERFLAAFLQSKKVAVEKVASWDYPLVASQEFHREQARLVRVGGYKFVKA